MLHALVEDDYLERFKLISDEFGTIKFDKKQPLTFESVPWPVLHSPLLLVINDIEWAAVEESFEAIEDLLTRQASREFLQKRKPQDEHGERKRVAAFRHAA